MCGGAQYRHKTFLADRGRSPRVRGSHVQKRRSPLRPGSIPACAGEPGSLSSVSSSSKVDPRVCGGAVPIAGPAFVTGGRSPRVRGSPLPSPQCRHHSGSIPACAGEPSVMGRILSWGGVDPRVCGGAQHLPRPRLLRRGRSPRVRGSLEGAGDGLGEERSIPACAGEPPTRPSAAPTTRVDPRVCGGANDTTERAHLH